MKTINGAPQFEESNGVVPLNRLERSDVNKKLREWAESRRCVKCEKFDGSDDFKYCDVINEYINDVDPETFSCAAFEEKK